VSLSPNIIFTVLVLSVPVQRHYDLAVVERPLCCVEAMDQISIDTTIDKSSRHLPSDAKFPATEVAPASVQ